MRTVRTWAPAASTASHCSPCIPRQDSGAFWSQGPLTSWIPQLPNTRQRRPQPLARPKAHLAGQLESHCGWPATSNMLRILLAGGVLTSVVLATIQGGSVMRGVSDLISAGLILTLPLIIVMRFRRNLYVNVQSVLGAVCIYLVIGIVYANVDSALGHLTGQQFFAEAPAVTSSQFMYFSMVTLCTVGYGDLTPETAGGRALAVSEALMGQLYLVTVISLLVSNFGRARQPQSSR